VWVSLGVKALRIGWPEGLRMTEQMVGKSRMRHILTCGLYEDVFPAMGEHEEAWKEIGRLDYEALCRRETHHGRGLTAKFCGMADEAMKAARERGPWIYKEASKHSIWLPPRAYNCFYTWLKMAPDLIGVRREIDKTKWAGVPAAVVDGHTREGRDLGRRITILSGHYENHLKLGQMVGKIGWAKVRKMVHANKTEWDG